MIEGGKNLENSDKLDVATKTTLGTVNIKTSVALNNIDDIKITKVLTATARPDVEKIDVDTGEIRFGGNIDYDFLVVLENGEIMPLTQKAPFEGILQDSNIAQTDSICFAYSLTDLSCPTALSYSSSFDFEFGGVTQNQDLESASVPEGAFIKEDEIYFDSLTEKVKYDGNLNFELSKDSKVNKVLFVKNCAVIKSAIPSNDYFVVAGDIYSTIVYQTEEGQIKAITKENSFSEEIEAKGTTKDSNIQAKMITRETIVNQNEDGSRFIFDIPFVIYAQIYNRKQGTCVKDAYNLNYEVNLTTTSFIQNEFQSTKLAEENLLTNFTLTENVPTIDKILAVIPTNIRIVGHSVKNNEINIEGIASINIIYYHEDDDGNNELNSIDVDVPFSLNFSALDVIDNDMVDLDVCFGDVNVKSRHGNELEILSEIKINYNTTRQSVSSITTQIVLGDEKPQKDYALEIYIAKQNQTLWDIAKELNVSVTDLISQNGELSIPLAQGQKIISYTRLKSNLD